MAASVQTSTSESFTEAELVAWRGFLRTYATLTKDLDAELEAAHGLPLVSFEVLAHLSEADGGRLRMNDLAERVRLSRSGLTRLVDRLEAGGLIERAQCSSDARGSWAVLTDDGAARFRAARATHLAKLRERFLSGLTPEELRILGDVFERISPDRGEICGQAFEET
jgi:DNA-binding MarR family transcriptional regulator